MWIRKFLNIFLALILLIYSTSDVLSQNTQTQQGTPSGLENYLKVRIVDFSGGQNSKFYADKIKDNQGAFVSNGEIEVPGQITTRDGQALFNVDTQSAAFNGISRFDIENGTAVTSYLLAASGSQAVSSLNNSANWTQQNQGYPIPTSNPINFVQANNLMFVLNGNGNTMWWNGGTGISTSPNTVNAYGNVIASGVAINWNGGGVYNPNGTVTVGGVAITYPPNATTGTWLNNYLFLAGNSVFPDYIFYSQNLLPTSFPVVNAQEIQSGDGQPIQHLEPYRTGDIVVYKGSPVSMKGSTYDFNINGANVPNATTCIPQPGCEFSYTPLTLDVGTLSPRSVVSLGNDQWFLSSVPFGVRSVIRSQFDKLSVNLISQPIQDYFDGTGTVTINPTQVSKACAVYYDNKYILAFATGSSTVNNTVAVYDMIAQAWYVINGWYPGQWIVYQGNLYYIDANDGRVIQCFTGTQGDFGTAVPATQASGPTVGIDFQFISKIYDFDNPENYKFLNALIIEYQPTATGTATISVNLDNTGWQTAGTVSLQPANNVLPLTLPFNLIPTGVTYQTIQLTQFGRFKKIQFKIEVNSPNQVVQLQKVTAIARLVTYNLE